MAFGNDGKIDKSEQAKLREARKNAMFSSSSVTRAASSFPKNILVEVPIELIDPNPKNEKVFSMREIENLAVAIKENGYDIAFPVALFEKPDGRFETSAGHRRVEACKLNGMDRIPAIVKADMDSAKRARLMIDSNIYNRSLTFLDYARSMEYYRTECLIPEGFKGNVRDEIAKHFKLSPAEVQRYMSVLKLIPELQELADTENFPASGLSSAVRLSQEHQMELYQNITKFLHDQNSEEASITKKQLTDMIEAIKRREKFREEYESKRAVLEQAGIKKTAEPEAEPEMKTFIPEPEDVSPGMKVQSLEEAFDDGFADMKEDKISYKMKEPPKSSFVGEATIEYMAASKEMPALEVEYVQIDEEPQEVEGNQEGQPEIETAIELPVQKSAPKVKSKVDFGLVATNISEQIQELNLDDYDINNRETAKKILQDAIEKLSSLLEQI